MEKLQQRKLFVTRSFEFTSKGLLYKFKNLTSSFEIEIPFEEIGRRKIYQRLTNNQALFFAIFMLCAASAKTYYFITGEHDDLIFTLIVLGIFLATSLFTYHSFKDIILIEASNPQFIEFYSGRPNKETVENFLSELHSRSKQFLIKKYAERDFNLPLETQLEMISLLRNRDVIDQKEYQELTNKLSGPKSNPIGF